MELYQTILLAVNPDDPNKHKLMVKAALIAKKNNADLHVAYVEPGIGNVSFMDVELELESVHNELEMKRMQQLSTLAKSSDYEVRAIHIASGDVAKHLIKLAKDINSNLVIVGHHKGIMHWFSDVSQSLAEHLSSDVLICQ